MGLEPQEPLISASGKQKSIRVVLCEKLYKLAITEFEDRKEPPVRECR